MDQGDNKAMPGQLLRRQGSARVRNTDADRASGITFDGEAPWIGSTYNREIVRCDAKTGVTLARYFTPGAGIIYRTAWDAPVRSSPLQRPPRPAPAEPAALGQLRRP